jgi:signal transduction histidine kinase
LDKRFLRKDGTVVNCGAYVSCTRNPDGTPSFFLAAMLDISERKQAEQVLLKQTVFEERQRLARDLHDSVNQSINGLMLFSETLVATLDKNNIIRARQIAGRIQETTRQALKETRLLLYEMQSADGIRSVNFIQDLEMRLLTVERRAGVRAQITQEGSLDCCPREWYENIFWITIEALNNALKHAQARSVQVIIRCPPSEHRGDNPRFLELEIVDDGKGFDSDHPHSGGLGLGNMHERAKLLDGQLTIRSTPGKGTTVCFTAEIKE